MEAEMRWRQFVPANPPADGRYLVQRSDRSWQEAWYSNDEMSWKYPDSSGPMPNVWFFMVVEEADPEAFK